MSGPWGSEGNLDDSDYIERMRELLEDWPVQADEQASANGAQTKLKLQRLKPNDDDYFTVVVNGFEVPLVSRQGDVAAGNCYCEFNTGTLIFGTPPPAGTNNVMIYHNQVRWRDGAIRNALYDGLADLFPVVWRNAVDTSITMRVLTWDYQLPSDFSDPRVKIRRIGIREIPASTNRFRPMNCAWQVYGNPPLLRITTSQFFTPGATLQLEYAAPFRSLADLEPQAVQLPIYYAMGVLLAGKESQRARADGQTVAADTNAQPPQYQQNAGAWWMSLYRQKKAAAARTLGGLRPTSVYAT